MKKHINKRNIVMVLGLIFVTIMFLQRYDIYTVNDMIFKFNYLSKNWKDINMFEVIIVITTYISILSDNNFKSEMFNKVLGEVKKYDTDR